MGKQKENLGSRGEEAAARYLKKKGHLILHRNKRFGGVEFDIISKLDEILCFTEVKTRSTSAFGYPEEFIDKKKRERLIRGARFFASKDQFTGYQIRFDAISVIMQDDDFSIHHFEDAFEDE